MEELSRKNEKRLHKKDITISLPENKSEFPKIINVV